MAVLDSEICFSSVTEIGGGIRARQFTSREITSCFLDRISDLDPHLRSYAQVLRDSAIDEAARADREFATGFDRGPLHGIPIAIKDLIDSEGVATAAGMPLRAGNVPEQDATVLRRLRAAGAVILGKLTLCEGATLVHHPEIPVPRNPWNEGRSSGFSSSGSGVAVAAGLCAAALGSDTGGSIRIPSSFNGVTGLKPTWGRVSRQGVFPAVECLDTVGPMARTAAGAAAMLEAIAGADSRDPTASSVAVPPYLATIGNGIAGLSIGVDWSRVEAECAPRIAEGLHDVAERLVERGARIRVISLPEPDTTLLMTLAIAGVADVHRSTYPNRADDYGPALGGMLATGLTIEARDVARAINAGNIFKAQVHALFDDIDFILAPSMIKATPNVGEWEAALTDPAVHESFSSYTLPFNVSGNPTITFPTGFLDGMPTAAQMIGPHFGEEALLRAVHVYQSRTDWHLRRPGLPGAAA